MKKTEKTARKGCGRTLVGILLAGAVLAFSLPSSALAAKASITFYGHAAFKIVTPSGGVILIDPWVKNPLNPDKETVSKLGRVDYILLSHGHFDHVGQTVEIGKKTGAELVASFGLGMNLVSMYDYPKKQAGFGTLGNPGGTIKLPKAGAQVTFVAAVHSSALNAVKPQPGQPSRVASGAPVGYVLEIDNGPTIYFTGDTDVTMDMALIDRLYDVDVMLVNTGDHFNMSPRRAAVAVDLVKPKKAVPMHFKTFAVLAQSAEPFRAELKKLGLGDRFLEMQPGETRRF